MRAMGGLLSRRRLTAMLAGTALAPFAARGQTGLTFGLTPVFLDNDTRLLALMQRYFERHTGRPVSLVKRRSYQEVTVLLLAGQLDAAWICGYPYVQHRDRLTLVAVPVWRGAPLYRSYIIVRRDHPARRVEDLAGDIHAFSDPDSNSGYLATATYLIRRGRRPGEFFRHVFFTYGHRNVVRAVARGLADSGSVDGYVFEVLAERSPELVAGCRVLHRSAQFGFPPVAARTGSPDTEVLRAALLAMPQDAVGREILGLLRLDGFTETAPSLYDTIAANARILALAS